MWLKCNMHGISSKSFDNSAMVNMIRWNVTVICPTPSLLEMVSSNDVCCPQHWLRSSNFSRMLVDASLEFATWFIDVLVFTVSVVDFKYYTTSLVGTNFIFRRRQSDEACCPEQTAVSQGKLILLVYDKCPVISIAKLTNLFGQLITYLGSTVSQ